MMKIQQINVYLYYALCTILLTFSLTLVKAGPIEALNFWNGLFFWFVHVSVAIFIYSIINLVLQNFITSGPILNFVICSIIGSLLFGVVAIFLEVPFFLTKINFEVILNEVLHASTQSILFWILINIPLLISSDLESAKQTPVLKEKDFKVINKIDSDSRILQLINQYGEKPIYIQSEGNYLRVHFASKNILILYSLKDAANELDYGIQIHRSFWVNKSEISKRIYKNKLPYINLKNGVILPIGRTFFKNIKNLSFENI